MFIDGLNKVAGVRNNKELLLAAAAKAKDNVGKVLKQGGIRSSNKNIRQYHKFMNRAKVLGHKPE